MSFYSDMQKVATSVLTEFKQGAIKLVQFSQSEEWSPDDPDEQTEVIYDLNGTVSGVSYEYLKEGYAVSTDLTVVAAVVDGVTPTENDFVDIDGVRYKIIKDVSVPSAGTKVVWKFIVRKGG